MLSPTETHYFQYSGHWVDYRLRYALPKIMGRQELIDSFVNFIQDKNKHADRYADSVLENQFNVELFRNHLEKSDFQSPTQLFKSYIQAIYLSLEGKTLSEKIRIVEKSVENAEFAVFLKQMMPDSRFVHIIRNPYATLAAIRQSKTKDRYPYLRDYLLLLQNSYYYLFKNKALIDNYLVIRYEDLLSDPSNTMKRVSDFLEIDFTNSLLEPTIMGKKWAGNSSNNQSFEKISKKPLTNWKSTITDLEIQLVNQFFTHILENHNYEKLSTKKNYYFPVKRESIENYIKNRALLWLTPGVQIAP